MKECDNFLTGDKFKILNYTFENSNNNIYSKLATLLAFVCLHGQCQLNIFSAKYLKYIVFGGNVEFSDEDSGLLSLSDARIIDTVRIIVDLFPMLNLNFTFNLINIDR